MLFHLNTRVNTALFFQAIIERDDWYFVLNKSYKIAPNVTEDNTQS